MFRSSVPLLNAARLVPSQSLLEVGLYLGQDLCHPPPATVKVVFIHQLVEWAEQWLLPLHLLPVRAVERSISPIRIARRSCNYSSARCVGLVGVQR